MGRLGGVGGLSEAATRSRAGCWRNLLTPEKRLVPRTAGYGGPSKRPLCALGAPPAGPGSPNPWCVGAAFNLLIENLFED